MKKLAFTLAEVLITLVVIGVIAAITVPTLMNNYRKQQYVSGLKKAYSTVQNGFRTYLAQEGSTSLPETALWQAILETYAGGNAMDKATSELNKAFSVSKYTLVADESDENVAVYDYLGCSLDHKMLGLYLYMNDGSIVYFTPFPMDMAADRYPDIKEKVQSIGGKYYSHWADVYIDINGDSKPNKLGRDTFSFILTEEAALIPQGSNTFHQIRSGQNCPNCWADHLAQDWACYTDGGVGADGYGCAARIMEEGWEMNY